MARTRPPGSTVPAVHLLPCPDCLLLASPPHHTYLPPYLRCCPKTTKPDADQTSHLAPQADVRLLVDAEHSYFQPAIDNTVTELQRQYNRTAPRIYNTVQVGWPALGRVGGMPAGRAGVCVRARAMRAQTRATRVCTGRDVLHLCPMPAGPAVLPQGLARAADDRAGAGAAGGEAAGRHAKAQGMGQGRGWMPVARPAGAAAGAAHPGTALTPIFAQSCLLLCTAVVPQNYKYGAKLGEHEADAPCRRLPPAPPIAAAGCSFRVQLLARS